MKYKPSLPERELVDTHSHLQFCQVPFCKQCWFTHLCLRHSASAVTQFISQRMMGVLLFLCHCFLSLTVSLFTSISICFHLYEFTSSSGFFFTSEILFSSVVWCHHFRYSTRIVSYSCPLEGIEDRKNERNCESPCGVRIYWTSQTGRWTFPFCFFLLFLNMLFIYFQREGKGRKREGEKHQCVVASHMVPNGDLTRNPGVCPDWESIWWAFGSQPMLNPLSDTSLGKHSHLVKLKIQRCYIAHSKELPQG